MRDTDGSNSASPSPGIDRRRMLRGTGATAAGIAALAAAGLVASTPEAEAQAVNDAAILNFALNLEYLEAEFYSRAYNGQPLPASLTSGTGQGTVTGPNTNGVPFVTPAIKQYAAEIAQDEINHVTFLRAALSGQAVGEPTIDLVNSFITLGNLVGVSNFNPFADEDSFLVGSFIFEDVGVTAYHGAAPLVQNKQILAAAAGILAVEAYHASEVRLQLFQLGSTYQTLTTKIAAVRASLSGAQDDQGVVTSSGTANIVPTDSNSLAFSRTPRQVLNIVYGGVNAASGLFFPNGMNGAIK